MKLVFVHGWSVINTDTYGELPEVLQKFAPNELNLEIENIYLGEYISFHDEVTLYDIARAFESARKDKLGEELFACITHSTGGPIIRLWIDLFFKNNMNQLPLSHLVMLAPANHGSALAILGKRKVGRIKAWWDNIEPGVGVLNWLQLGSEGQWDLNNSWLHYCFGDSFFPFVLSGEKIDEHFYDFLNHYLVEKGTDGVIRLSSANMNYQKVILKQYCSGELLNAKIDGITIPAYPLKLQGEIVRIQQSAFEIIPNISHSGERYGIMKSVKKDCEKEPLVVNSIIKSLLVNNKVEYDSLVKEMKNKSLKLQDNIDQYTMLVFNINDNYGNKVEDFDMFLLAGDDYEPSKLPKGFFMDRQKNDLSGSLIYYINYTKLYDIKNKKLGIRIIARPDEGFVHYQVAEFRLNEILLDDFLHANETLMIEIILERRISNNTFLLNTMDVKNTSFKDRQSSDIYI